MPPWRRCGRASRQCPRAAASTPPVPRPREPPREGAPTPTAESASTEATWPSARLQLPSPRQGAAASGGVARRTVLRKLSGATGGAGSRLHRTVGSDRRPGSGRAGPCTPGSGVTGIGSARSGSGRTARPCCRARRAGIQPPSRRAPRRGTTLRRCRATPRPRMTALCAAFAGSALKRAVVGWRGVGGCIEATRLRCSPSLFRGS